MVNYNMLNGVALAYIGDSCYDIYIRKYLLDQGYTKVHELHKKATKYVSATAQANIIDQLMKQNFLTEEEITIVKRGRNAKINHKRPNVDILTYKHGTSFEALIGYLYLLDRTERLSEVIRETIKIVETGD